jgi:ParB-like chromosome segregation protein Spo0J
MSKTTKKEQALALLEKGMSAADVAKQVGTSRQYVYSLSYKSKKKAAPKKATPTEITVNGKVDEKEWLQVKRADIPKPKVGYEVTVRAVGLDSEELDDLLASVREYGIAEVTKVVSLR